MKKLVAIAVLVLVAWLGYRWFDGLRAYRAYEGFAEAWAREDRNAAAKYGSDDVVRRAFEQRALRGTQGGAAMEAFRGTLYAVLSRERTADGDVELVVNQTILFDPPGATTAIGGAMFARFRDTSTVRKTPTGWRVVTFEPAFLEMGPLRRPR